MSDGLHASCKQLFLVGSELHIILIYMSIIYHISYIKPPDENVCHERMLILNFLCRESELAAALEQAAEERAILHRELNEARSELRVTQRQLEVGLK